jgi:hypothetical protein
MDQRGGKMARLVIKKTIDNGCSFNEYCLKNIGKDQGSAACMNPIYYLDVLKRDCDILEKRKEAVNALKVLSVKKESGLTKIKLVIKTKEDQMAKLVMKKAVAKKAEKKATTGTKKTVANLMRETLGKDIDFSFQKLQTLVKKQFPKSKWDEKHYAWYKSRIAANKLKGC